MWLDWVPWEKSEINLQSGSDRGFSWSLCHHDPWLIEIRKLLENAAISLILSLGTTRMCEHYGKGNILLEIKRALIKSPKTACQALRCHGEALLTWLSFIRVYFTYAFLFRQSIIIILRRDLPSALRVPFGFWFSFFLNQVSGTVIRKL